MAFDSLLSVVHIPVTLSYAAVSGTWDLSQYGWVYSVAPGPYGTFVAGCWDVATQQARVVHVNPHADGAPLGCRANSAPDSGLRSCRMKPCVHRAQANADTSRDLAT